MNINQEYLQYWIQTMRTLDLLEKLLSDNITEYLRTHDIDYLEFITETVKEIRRLIPIKEEYYRLTFPDNYP